jgi:hypothetical protein
MKKEEKETMKLPNLAEMTDVEAIQRFTGTQASFCDFHGKEN